MSIEGSIAVNIAVSIAVYIVMSIAVSVGGIFINYCSNKQDARVPTLKD